MKHYNNRYFLFTLFLVLILFSVKAQDSDKFWSKTSALEKRSSKKIERKSMPNEFGVYQLNLNTLKSTLINAPLRKGKLTASNAVLSFPNENGELEKYQVFEAPIMEESLQKKYPNIKSYVGKGIDNPNSTVRLTVTSLGLHAMISQKSGEILYIDPYTLNKETYITYTKKSLPVPEQFECKVDEFTKATNISVSNTVAKTDNANDGILRTFRLAVATTGEYSQFHLNNQGISPTATDIVKKEAVLSAIVAIINRVNGVFERDVALTMVLVANNTDIIFLDATTDGFTNNTSSALIDESQTIIDATIGAANYDIGHTFSTGGGGLAQLRSPCTSSKARGITGLNNPIGDPYAIDYVAHEMGHQYGANHTFNTDAGSCGGNVNNGTAVEPGSGSTIMAYAGLCSPNNVQNSSDAYFHLVSIREMWTNISSGNSNCGTQTSANNSTPSLDVLSNYIIPISTPFILKASATDIDGDNLTYTWEQLDAEITPHPLVSTATGGPAFRSLSPTSSSMRYFPAQSTVIAGNLSTTWEVLPSVARTMKFGVTVRDNHVNAGQSASDETTITVDGNSGPFKITSQSTNETWDAGTAQTVTWNVANSNVAPVNCLFVNILLSMNGGLTYPITLASNVVNDGVHNIIAPNDATNRGRIKVESVGNVFYAMNTTNITIQTSEFIMNFVSNNEATCSPNNIVYTFTYNTFLGFNEEATFSASGYPTGTIVTFNPTSATANNTTVDMTVSNILGDDVGNHTISVIGSSSSTTKTTVVNLDVYSSIINAPTLVSPLNNATSILKPYELSWTSDINALNYDVQISTNNIFSSINEGVTVNTNSYIPLLLQLNTNYFWRVKSKNDCGESGFSSVYNFTTANETCSSKTSTGTPLGIPDNNATGVSSTVNVVNNKIITDVNVTVNITHPWIGDLTLTLISPEGTSILLVSSRDDDGENYTNTVFDDAAINSINSSIAPYTGLFIPQGSLSNLNNEESTGNWTLKAVDEGPADIGTIDNWTIEICGVDIIRDTDGDGVLDSVDLCPNTPALESVNANGCSNNQLDDDNDGVQNSLDLCPATPALESVNANGCGNSQLDDDNDGVMNNVDLCPNTPTLESVNANGCSNGQLDDDNDGVMNNVDLCPNTPALESVDTNGCSNSQLDDDNDGVMNNVDLCPNTPATTSVDANGCLTLPPTNFSIEVKSETCPNKSNGEILISANSSFTYTTIIDEVPYSFTNTSGLTVTDLAPKVYNFCISVTEQTFKQCYTVEIIAGSTVFGKSSVIAGKASIEIEEGTAPFTVFVNGIEKFETNSSVFNVDVKHGDIVEVKTAKSCEGVYSKTMELLEVIVAYPNPNKGAFEISLPNSQKEVTIALYTIHSHLISVKTYPILYGRVQLHIENQPTGVY
ncbi:MAG: thrombospondin type 3 repeat-containing protein, partial [Lutibacter sp.]|nr:thrombospondin type 3 repeat-containing protein [Lutibacter sp.]